MNNANLNELTCSFWQLNLYELLSSLLNIPFQEQHGNRIVPNQALLKPEKYSRIEHLVTETNSTLYIGSTTLARKHV